MAHRTAGRHRFLTRLATFAALALAVWLLAGCDAQLFITLQPDETVDGYVSLRHVPHEDALLFETMGITQDDALAELVDAVHPLAPYGEFEDTRDDHSTIHRIYFSGSPLALWNRVEFGKSFLTITREADEFVVNGVINLTEEPYSLLPDDSTPGLVVTVRFPGAVKGRAVYPDLTTITWRVPPGHAKSVSARGRAAPAITDLSKPEAVILIWIALVLLALAGIVRFLVDLRRRRPPAARRRPPRPLPERQ